MENQRKIFTSNGFYSSDLFYAGTEEEYSIQICSFVGSKFLTGFFLLLVSIRSPFRASSFLHFEGGRISIGNSVLFAICVCRVCYFCCCCCCLDSLLFPYAFFLVASIFFFFSFSFCFFRRDLYCFAVDVCASSVLRQKTKTI